MKTSNHSSTNNVSLIVNGTYVKIYKFTNLLFVLHTISVVSINDGGASINILTITHQDNSTQLLKLPTNFGNLLTTKSIEYFLPFNVKNIVLTTQASNPYNPGGPGQG